MLEKYYHVWRKINVKKFKIAVTVATVLWIVAALQLVITRIYITENGFTEAFARNHVTVLQKESREENADQRNKAGNNQCLVGEVSGQLSAQEQTRLAADIMKRLGGRIREQYPVDQASVYYGYTCGIARNKKVMGHATNLNIAIRYDKNDDKTKVILGSPIYNGDT